MWGQMKLLAILIYIWLFFSREREAQRRGMKRRTSQLKQEANEREPKNDTAKVE